MTRYTCSTKGRCEEDGDDGGYPSLSDCSASCTSVHGRDLVLLMYQYGGGIPSSLAPSDRSDILFGLTGRRYPVPLTRLLLKALEDKDNIPILLSYPELLQVAKSQWGVEEWLSLLANSNDVRALKYLDDVQPFIVNALMTEDNNDVLEELYDSGYNTDIAREEDIFLSPYFSYHNASIMAANDGDYLLYFLPEAERRGATPFLEAMGDNGF